MSDSSTPKGDCIMTLPGFTAQDSLYKTSGQYHNAFAPQQNQGMVTPAFVDPFCYSDCYSPCYNQYSNYRGWSAEDAGAFCSKDCNTRCTCTPYTIMTVNGLCTTTTTCCGSDCSKPTVDCIPKTLPPFPNSRFGGNSIFTI